MSLLVFLRSFLLFIKIHLKDLVENAPPLPHGHGSAFLFWNSDSLFSLSWETALLNCFKVDSDAAARIPGGLAEREENGGR